MPYPIVTCRCKDQGDPPPRSCRDDLFCSQCGESVAWIDSDHFLPVPDPERSGAGRPVLWVYRRVESDGSSVFELTLDFHELELLGGGAGDRPRDLELTPKGCSFKAPGFKPEVEITQSGDSKAVIRLVPLDQDQYLPPTGVRGRLTLAGNCGVVGQVLAGRPGDYDGLDVFVFSTPMFSTSIDGDGVQEDPNTKNIWQLWKDGTQKLTIRIEPTEAQVYLAGVGPRPSWPIEEDPDLPVTLIERPSPPAIYGPGCPAVIVLELEPQSWEPQESRALKLRLDFALVPPLELELGLKRHEGMLTWSTGIDLVIPPMFYGEKITTPPATPLLPEIWVSNAGSTDVPTKEPNAPPEGSSLRGVKWIEAGWDVKKKPDSVEQGIPRLVRLSIDLSGVNPAIHPQGDPLKAEVHVKHSTFGMTWKLGVTIQSVGHRPPLEAPLALDFGNTNSYASAEVPGRRESDPIAVRSLLGRPVDPETFASALAFRGLDDPEKPDYVIGLEALEVGKDDPLSLEKGFKRALSMLRPSVNADGERIAVDDPVHPFNRRRFIYPRDGEEPVRFSLRDLLRLYILEAISRCEVGSRRTVTQLGLSYPANLGPEPRRALNLVIRDVENVCKTRHPERAAEISFRPLGPDEASAVALGFVLDPAMLRDKIKHLFHENRASFLVASFDFGGGSIDIALIRFDLDGLLPLTTFSSTLLGLGGDEHFGGDNVTVAAYEILGARIAEALGPGKRLPLAPLDVHRNRADPRGWANRQAIWGAAEAAKRAACRGDSAGARDEIKAALEGLHSNDKANLGLILAQLTDGRLDLGLADIYQHQIACDLSGMGHYSVAERLRRSVAMLREFAERAGKNASPRFLVLAGAACRVPLARELLEAEFPFPDTVIVPEAGTMTDGYRPKSKVADGLARFLRASRGGAADPRVRGLKAANLFTHADLLWINPFLRDFPVVWVPSCVELNAGVWHPLMMKDVPDGIVPLNLAWNSQAPMAIDIHRRSSPEPELVGTARLDLPADLVESGITPHLPEPSDNLNGAEVLLRIDGEEDCLRLRIRVEGQEFGDWRVHLPPSP